MRLNGLYIVAEMAIRALDDPRVTRHRDAIVLGALREDVFYVPLVRRVIEHLSFSHFYRPGLPGGILPLLWPGPRLKADYFVRRGVEEARNGRLAAGFVQLGRAAHLLTDMSCPVHAHRTVHLTDPYEWSVEANKAALLEMPVPEVPDAARASDLIESLARFTQGFETDATNHPPGRLLKKLGLRAGVSAKRAREQAFALIPMVAGHTVSLLRLYLREIDASPSLRAAG